MSRSLGKACFSFAEPAMRAIILSLRPTRSAVTITDIAPDSSRSASAFSQSG
jgi:hypothetical protein